MGTRKFSRFWFGVALSCLWTAATPYAADIVVRASKIGSSTRIVVDGVANPTSIKQQFAPNSIELTLPEGSAIALDPSLAKQGIKATQNGARVSLSAGTFSPPAVSKIGSRLLLDTRVSGPLPETPVEPAKEPAKETEQKVEAKVEPKAELKPEIAKTPAPEPKAEPAAETPPAIPTKPVEPTTQPAPLAEKASVPAAQLPAPSSTTAPEPATPVAEPALPAAAVAETEAVATQTPAPAPQAQEFALRLSSTNPFALAAFEHNNAVWIVTDQMESPLPPVFEGDAQSVVAGEVQTLNLPNGRAYRVNLESPRNLVVSGGGLVWRVTFTTAEKAPPLTELRKSAGDDGLGRVVMDMKGITATKLSDPDTGEDLAVIMTNTPDEVQANHYKLVDFDVLPAACGALIKPKADGVAVELADTTVSVTRKGGLRLDNGGPSVIAPTLPKAAEEPLKQQPITEKDLPQASVFSFTQWMRGETEQLPKEKNTLVERAATANATPVSTVTVQLDLAKLMVAHGMGPEALGYLEVAEGLEPSLKTSPEYKVIAGAAHVLAQKPENALEIFAAPEIAAVPEIQMWRGLALAQQGKLQQAFALMPTDFSLLKSYPENIRRIIVPVFLDVALTRKDGALYTQLFTTLPETAADEALNKQYEALLNFYKGHFSLFKDQPREAQSQFEIAAANEKGGSYTIRSILALSDPLLFRKPKEDAEMLERMERHRYAWRGDKYEFEINQRLGTLYMKSGQDRKGLYIMRDAVAITEKPEIKQELETVMQQAFINLFRKTGKQKLPPIEAATIALEFKNLIPTSAEGDAILDRVIEDLISIDLLERATLLIEQKIELATDPEQKATLAERAASLKLIDKKPVDALKLLEAALVTADTITTEATKTDVVTRLKLLHVRALGDSGQTETALQEVQSLPVTAESLKLQADIAWKAKRWGEAASAFAQLLQLAPPPANKPLSNDDAQMVFNMALAYNLAGDSGGLDQLAVAWGTRMQQTPLARPFQMLSRVDGGVVITDRDSLMKMVSEVDLFRDVLQSYLKTPSADNAVGTQ